MRYDTARSSSWGWGGLPKHPSLLRYLEPRRRRPQVALSPDSEMLFWLALKPILWLYKISLTCITCHLVRIIKWWLSDQLPLWYFLCISINGFEGQLCKCNLCITVYSFVLCRKIFALLSQPAFKQVAFLIGKLNTCVSSLVYVNVKIFL